MLRPDADYASCALGKVTALHYWNPHPMASAKDHQESGRDLRVMKSVKPLLSYCEFACQARDLEARWRPAPFPHALSQGDLRSSTCEAHFRDRAWTQHAQENSKSR